MQDYRKFKVSVNGRTGRVVGQFPIGRPLARGMTGGNGASLYSSFSNYPPEMFRLSRMPIKIEDRPFKFGTRL
jgi:hypothetical protein